VAQHEKTLQEKEQEHQSRMERNLQEQEHERQQRREALSSKEQEYMHKAKCMQAAFDQQMEEQKARHATRVAELTQQQEQELQHALAEKEQQHQEQLIKSIQEEQMILHSKFHRERTVKQTVEETVQQLKHQHEQAVLHNQNRFAKDVKALTTTVDRLKLQVTAQKVQLNKAHERLDHYLVRAATAEKEATGLKQQLEDHLAPASLLGDLKTEGHSPGGGGGGRTMMPSPALSRISIEMPPEGGGNGNTSLNDSSLSLADQYSKRKRVVGCGER
jgi:hypothetical protein